MTALAIIHKDAILARIRNGEITRTIAADYGISGQAIRQALKNDPEYHEAHHEQASSMIEDAQDETWAARDPLAIARAREMTKFAFRYAESVDPQRWAPRSHVTVEHAGDLAERLRRSKERVIEQAPDNQSVALPNASPVDTGT